MPGRITVWTDSNWAGCARTRRSTSGGALFHGSHLIKAWSHTQGHVALSSGEAEYYALAKGVAQALGTTHMMVEWGAPAGRIKAYTDATAAKGIASRRGVGKVRHICVTDLWLQEQVQRGSVDIIKVASCNNIADAMTKHVPSDGLIRMLTATGARFLHGRHPLAPEAD
eukprot:gene1107-biopygen217